MSLRRPTVDMAIVARPAVASDGVVGDTDRRALDMRIVELILVASGGVVGDISMHAVLLLPRDRCRGAAVVLVERLPVDVFRVAGDIGITCTSSLSTASRVLRVRFGVAALIDRRGDVEVDDARRHPNCGGSLGRSVDSAALLPFRRGASVAARAGESVAGRLLRVLRAGESVAVLSVSFGTSVPVALSHFDATAASSTSVDRAYLFIIRSIQK